MTRKRGRGARRPGPQRPSARRRRRPGRLVAVAILVAASGALWWWLARTRAPVEPGASHSILEYDEANRAALALARAGRHLESIPYFRQAVRLEPDSPTAHENLASSLGNGAQQARVHLGKTDNAVRSSVERIAMMQETMAETEQAQRLARTKGERVLAMLEQGRTLYTWGFPIDALDRMRAAEGVAPNTPVVQTSVTKLERELATGTR